MLEYAEQTVDDIVAANLDLWTGEWPLEGLAGKMAQYCYFMNDIDEQTLRAEANKGGSTACAITW